MLAGTKYHQAKFIDNGEDFSRAVFAETFSKSSQPKVGTGKFDGQKISKLKSNTYNDDYSKSVEVRSRAFNSERELKNFKIEQFVYQPMTGEDDAFPSQKQIMLLFDDQSLDDESDSYEDIDSKQGEIIHNTLLDPFSPNIK